MRRRPLGYRYANCVELDAILAEAPEKIDPSWALLQIDHAIDAIEDAPGTQEYDGAETEKILARLIVRVAREMAR